MSSKKTKLDPTRVTYNGSSLNLVILDNDKFEKEIKKEQEEIEQFLIKTNHQNKKIKNKLF